MERLDRVSLRDASVRTLKAEIVSGALLPGVLYAIGDVATTLGVSATPVREALLGLQNQGLIEMVRNRGFRVREVSDRELDDILTVRVMVEVPAMRLLAELEDRPEFTQARAQCDRLQAAALAGDIARFLAEDRDLHVGLTALLSNEALTEVVGNLRDRTRLYGLRLMDLATLEATAAEHFDLVAALEAGDAERAGSLMTAHLRHIRSDWSATPEAVRTPRV